MAVEGYNKGVLLRTPLEPHAFAAVRAPDKLSRSSQRLAQTAKLKFCPRRLFCDFAVIYTRLALKAAFLSRNDSVFQHHTKSRAENRVAG